MATSKTIFITSFFGFIARNILATTFLELMRQDKNLRIVIFTPDKKAERHRREFGGGNIIVEGVSLKTPSRFERLLTVIFHNLSDTNTWRIHRLIHLKRDKNYLGFALYWVLSKLGYLKFVRNLARWVDFQFSPKNRFQKYFDEYRPDLVFATDVFEPNDVDMMREAKHRGILVAGMVRSWDNITSKGLNRIIPDKLIVNTERIKEEAIKYNDVLPENIFVVGIPHYDYYVTEKRTGRAALFEKLSLDPKKKLIFFAPPADLYANRDPIAVKVLDVLYPLEAQILVRMPLVGETDLGRYQSVPQKLAIDEPGSASDFVSADISRSGDAHLADLLYHSDVVVAFASTLAIDAVAFNKPVVFVGFDAEPRPYWDSLTRYYDYDHQRALLETGGIRLARNPEELVRYVNDYLKNPELDATGRKRIINDRCWKLDGHSGERLANIIKKFVYER